VALAANAQPRDRALIEALQLRYADPAPSDRMPLDRAYRDGDGGRGAAVSRRR
jgi:hypothetical protein